MSALEICTYDSLRTWFIGSLDIYDESTTSIADKDGCDVIIKLASVAEIEDTWWASVAAVIEDASILAMRYRYGETTWCWS